MIPPSERPGTAVRSDRTMLLAIDTATQQAAVALGDGLADTLAERSWRAGYRHGEELLAAIADALREASLELPALGGVVAGIGPGSFTGLRVGLATAKGLAYGLRIPIVGVATTEALAEAAWAERETAAFDRITVLLPAGPHDRYVATYARGRSGLATALDGPRLLAGHDQAAVAAGAMPGGLVAVDLDEAPGLPAAAVSQGRRAQARLGSRLLALGRAALAAGRADDVAELVPVYVTLPRGIREQSGEIAWSRDLR